MSFSKTCQSSLDDYPILPFIVGKFPVLDRQYFQLICETASKRGDHGIASHFGKSVCLWMNSSYPGAHKVVAEAMEAAGDIDAAIELMRMAVCLELAWNKQNQVEALDYLQRLLESKQNDEKVIMEACDEAKEDVKGVESGAREAEKESCEESVTSLKSAFRRKAREEGAFKERMMRIDRITRHTYPSGNIVDYEASTDELSTCISMNDPRLDERVLLYTEDGEPLAEGHEAKVEESF